MTAAGQHPTGAQLLDELRAAARKAGVPLTTFVKALTPTPANLIAQLSRAGRPLPATIARVRACIAGDPIPPPRPSPFKGCTGHRKTHSAEVTRIGSAELERRRRLAEAAHADRRPGETLEHAIKRVSAESIAAQPIQPPPLEGDNQ